MSQGRGGIIFLLGAIAGALACGALLQRCQKQPERQTETITLTKRDTITRVDTIVAIAPVEKVRTVERTETIRVAIAEVRGDSATAAIEIESATYEDSLWRVRISGWRPRLEEIEILAPTTAITATTIERRKPARWGIGASAGMAATTKGIQPYIGVGITYQILTWK